MIFSRRGRPTKLRLDYELIESLVPDGAKVLDLGCGDGQLLSDLIEHKRCVGRGIEIDETAVLECVRRGVPVYHGDMLEGMSFYRDGEFDVTILSQTLQQVMKPPNFGHWSARLGLLWTGRMPRTALLPYHWFNTPNVHLCTIKDFRAFCNRMSLARVREIFLTPGQRRIGPWLANWRAGLAIFQVQRA